MYHFNSSRKRIDWIYEKYSASCSIEKEEFVRLVNGVYYKHSVDPYEERYVLDISRQYRELFKAVGLIGRTDLVVVDIGGGAGFEYEQFLLNNVRFRRYVYIELDAEMIKKFTARADVNHRVVDIYHGRFEDYTGDIKAETNKLILINSCLHHVIWVGSLLNKVKECMNVGDLFVLCHEPNNSYYMSPLFIMNYLIRLLTTDILLKKLKVRNTQKVRKYNERWEKINRELMGLDIIKEPLRPIILRRIIDYGADVKGDWRKVGVPREFDEGHWTPKDLIEYFGASFKTLWFATYRHLGDPGGNRIIERMNRRFENQFANKGGMDFCCVLRKEK